MKMLTRYLFLGFLAVNFVNCNQYKKLLKTKGGTHQLIMNSIYDFSNTSKLYKKDSIFFVDFEDFNENIITVSIIKNNMKILFNENIKPGDNGKMPSRFYEKNGNLFFWWDNSYPITTNAIEVFKKYKILQLDDGTMILPDHEIDDKLKSCDYFICKNDYLMYKKITTNKGLGYYTPPCLKCK